MDLSPWSRRDLQAFCRQHGLDRNGTNEELEESINERLCVGARVMVWSHKRQVFRDGVVTRVLRQRKFEVQYDDNGKTAKHSLDDPELNLVIEKPDTDSDASSEYSESDLLDLPACWGLEEGTRITVMWVVKALRQKAGVWWPATLGRPVRNRVDEDGRQMYHIVYDPLEELGFEDYEKARVSFISDAELFDSRGYTMDWKLEEEEEEEEDDDDDDDEWETEEEEEEVSEEDEEYEDTGSERASYEEYGSGGYDVDRLAASMSGLGSGVLGRPRKRALIVGCSYRGTNAELGGTLNDAHDIWALLQEHFQYQQSSIMLLTDDHSDRMLLPTRRNILKGFEWLLRDLRPGDTLFFYFSGHGGSQEDPTGQEWRGNQTICPCDYEETDVITDTEIHERLVRPLPQQTKLHALIDSCHSGTVLNLPYNAELTHGVFEGWEEEYPGESWKRNTAGGLAVQFSAARADQTAKERSMGRRGDRRGAATYAFTEAIKRHKQHWGFNILYSELLEWMSDALRRSKFRDQDPQMSASTQFDPTRDDWKVDI